MDHIRYIHAADLHLNTPFSGIENENELFVEELKEAPYWSLRRLGDLCEREMPDFLVLSGDIYNQENDGVHPQLALLQLLKRLDTLKIPVFIVYGNHDALEERKKGIAWPENTFFFPDTHESFPVLKNNEIIARIHGASYASNPEKRNLASLFSRDDAFDGFQLGVLHTDLKNGPGNERYAPCSLEDLMNSGMDAWALGHVHGQQTIYKKPFIAYSGTTQGRHINETGPKGCLVVDARKLENEWICESRFCDLAIIQWERLEVQIDDAAEFEDVILAIEKRINEFIENVGVSGISRYIFRIALKGQTSLYHDLHAQLGANEILQQLNLPETGKKWYVKDLILEISPPSASLEQSQNLLGEIWRLAREMETNEQQLEELFRQCTEELSDISIIKKNASFVKRLLKEMTPSTMLEQAKSSCYKSLRKD